MQDISVTITCEMTGLSTLPYRDVKGKLSVGKYVQFQEQSIHTHALCHPNEVASIIVFLTSNAACFITGATVPVGGGRSVIYYAIYSYI